jgi:hypothetical protein
VFFDVCEAALLFVAAALLFVAAALLSVAAHVEMGGQKLLERGCPRR